MRLRQLPKRSRLGGDRHGRACGQVVRDDNVGCLEPSSWVSVAENRRSVPDRHESSYRRVPSGEPNQQWRGLYLTNYSRRR
jgi:hypothetical protein